MPTSFLDFDILIERAGDVRATIEPRQAPINDALSYRARVLNSPAGQGTTSFTLPVTETELENLRAHPSDVNLAREFGKKLFDALFSGDLQAALRSSLDETGRAQQGLRLRLRLADVPELATLPWEFLYHTSLDRFIALSDDTPLVRYLELPERIAPLAVKPPLKMLVLISAPGDYPPLDVEREWSLLGEALGDLERQGLLVRERLEHATLTHLQQKLRQSEYHILHYVGHGGFIPNTEDGALALEGDDGRGQLVSGNDFATILHDAKSLRLVVLNACESARLSDRNPFGGVAPKLVQQSLPAVTAMQFEVSDDAAISFSTGLYGALADGLPIDAALSEARKTILAKVNNAEWATPVLFLRAPDGKIFDLAQLSNDERKRLQVGGLDRAAQAALARADWATAIQYLQARQVLELSADAANKLQQATRQQQLAKLYAEGRAHYDAQQWREAVASFTTLKQLVLGFKDVDALLADAQKHLPPETMPAPAQPTAARTDSLAPHYASLAKALLDGRVVPFLGSGANLCGRPANAGWKSGAFLPSGAELAEHLASSYDYNWSDKSDLARVSQYIELMNGSGPLYDELHHILDADYPYTALHEFIATLPGLLRSKGLPVRYMLLVTTNFDDVLERAFRAADEPCDVVTYIAEGDQVGKFLHQPPGGDSILIDKPNEYRGLSLDQRTVILKLHGAVNRANPDRDSYVITEDDYIEYLARTDISNLIPVTLAAKLRRSNFLFLGYSLKDWNLRVILHRIWGDQKLSYKSWAVLLDPQPLDNEFWRKRDVEIINTRLEDYVAALSAQMWNLAPAGAKA